MLGLDEALDLCNIGNIAEVPLVVKAISNNEFVGNLESDMINRTIDFQAAWFEQEGGRGEASWLSGTEILLKIRHS